MCKYIYVKTWVETVELVFTSEAHLGSERPDAESRCGFVIWVHDVTNQRIARAAMRPHDPNDGRQMSLSSLWKAKTTIRKSVFYSSELYM